MRQDSVNDFSFIISATDVIGNSASVTSIDEFDFDARPAVTIWSERRNHFSR